MDLSEMFQKLWQDYLDFNPNVAKIHALFTARGEKVLNDHIALRTFNKEQVNVARMAEPFLENQYHICGQYTFKEKKLNAIHMEHEDKEKPKVFISEIKVEKFSDNLQDIVNGLMSQIHLDQIKEAFLPTAGRLWDMISFEEYSALRKESEYAAWLATFGFRVNHFTVSVNLLSHYSTLKDVNQLLKDNGFALNTSGGEIKGSPEKFLEQSSTMANEIEVTFSDQIKKIPSCYYEFAKRYPLPSGKLFQGFIEGSADKIFESTDKTE